MLMGEYNHTIDSKGRVIVPAKFREQIGEKFILAMWLDKCLMMVAPEEWEELCENMTKLSTAKRESRAFTRMLFSSATECDSDKQGRILIPAKLREYANLQKGVSFIGVSRRIEIWATETWDQYSNQAEEDFVDSAEKLGDIVF